MLTLPCSRVCSSGAPRTGCGWNPPGGWAGSWKGGACIGGGGWHRGGGRGRRGRFLQSAVVVADQLIGGRDDLLAHARKLVELVAQRDYPLLCLGDESPDVDRVDPRR